MEESDKQQQRKKKITEVNIFPVPFTFGEIKTNITINPNNPSKLSREQIINQGFKFHSRGNIQEAAKYYQLFITQGFTDARVFSIYGAILKSSFDWTYNDKETCFLLEDEVTVTPEGREPAKFGAGDLVVFPAGMYCRWDIHKQSVSIIDLVID
tara:strand:+ start:248 stop:709 length:462 start_codon:yes stop_codon:yes gene_type:complete